MGRTTIYISEDDTVDDIFLRCPLAIRVLERHLGEDFVKRDDLDKLSLETAVVLCDKQIDLILIELNRICI
jgi:hypothetical protein